MPLARLSLRIDLKPDGRLGPGKIALLERIDATGSISAAGRAMGMSYRRAWQLVDSLNQCFRESVVTTSQGGAAGGGAALTPFGRGLIERYRAMERAATRATARHLTALQEARARR
ncbi:MAG: LysR family transcriptional regulator [Alphaproteobacteria bacterium]|nr:LysR family transcriptional regulator [Alphaproteobacteria bacterium]